jgi:hypothetical protein
MNETDAERESSGALTICDLILIECVELYFFKARGAKRR